MLPLRKKRMGMCAETVNGLVESVMNAKQDISLDEMKSRYLRHYPEGIIQHCKEKYGLWLDTEPAFVAWPVFLGTGFEEINICAVNFGSMTLYNKHAANTHSGRYKYINAAINTLILTSLEREKNGETVRYWPTHIDYTNKVESGTIIQATLSLSSLDKFGFLDSNRLGKDRGFTRRQLVNRFEFVIEVINWILGLERVYGSYGVAWSYAEECKEAGNDKTIASAILPSQFCYDTLMRYYAFFNKDEDTQRIVNSINPSLIEHMRASLEAFEEWVNSEQRADGGYRRNSNESTSTFAFSCCAMTAYAYNKASDQSRFVRLVKYLCNHHRNFSQSLGDVVDIYRYKYEASEYSGYVNDAYEVFPESFFIINSFQSIDTDTVSLLPSSLQRRLRCVNYIAYEKIFARLEKIEIKGTAQNTVVTGRQEMQANRYPIYALYYTKKCLEKLYDNDSLPKKERRKYISFPSRISLKAICLSLALAVLVGIAYYISATDTVTSLVLGLATFIMPILGNMLFGSRGNSDK